MKREPTMRTLAEEYLAHRRGLGVAMQIEGAELLRFARYADDQGHRGPITIDLAVQWAKLPATAAPLYRARRLELVRRFAKHRWLFDPQTEIPPSGLLGPAYRRPPPHIYSEREIAELMRAASRLGPRGGLRPLTYFTLLGLLACTGIRISEALRLHDADVDLDSGVLAIRQTKFAKSRLVPLHVSAIEPLRDYVEQRDRRHPTARPDTFFLTELGTTLKYWRVHKTFTELRTRLGWMRPRSLRPPRIHDLRHTFAVSRLVHWYEHGGDVDRKIAALSTYLGHVKVTDTYWYLSAVPELLGVTSALYERFAKGASRGRR